MAYSFMSLSPGSSGNVGERTSANILFAGNCFEMFRPDTSPITAKVVPFETFGWHSDEEMVCLNSQARPDHKSSISSASSIKPDCTTVSTAGVDLLPKTNSGRPNEVGIDSLWHRVHSLMSMGQAVSAVLPFLVPSVRLGGA